MQAKLLSVLSSLNSHTVEEQSDAVSFYSVECIGYSFFKVFGRSIKHLGFHP